MTPIPISRLLHKLAFVAPGGTSLRPWLHRRRGVRLGRDVFIAQFVYIDELHPDEVSIGDNSTIGLRTSIFAHFYFGRRQPSGNGPVVIERDVFVGPNCVILPNVTIGEGSVIRAGTVVSRSVPPRTLWGPPAAGPLGSVGVPLTHEHTYEEFARSIRPHRPSRKQ